MSTSATNIIVSSNTHSSRFWSFINNGELYPLSTFIPVVVSEYVSEVCERSTVTIPVLPTLLYTSAIIVPILLSLFAEIVATSTIMLSVTSVDFSFNFSTTLVVISDMFRRTSVLLCLSVINSNPLNTKDSVKTIAVVVPSPALVAVWSAASFIILTARFSTGSNNSIDRATVTPSLVTVIPRK